MGNEAHRLGGALARQESYASGLDGWIVPPDTAGRRKRGRGSGPRRTETMIQKQLLIDLVEQFCTYQHKQRGKTEGGARTYQWNLERFLMFFRKHEGRSARISDLTQETVQVNLPRFGRHPRSHESAVGVCHGQTQAAGVHEGV